MKIVNDKQEATPVKYDNLDVGDCFRLKSDYQGLLVKTDYREGAVNLINGMYYNDLCGTDVYPVKVELHVIS